MKCSGYMATDVSDFDLFIKCTTFHSLNYLSYVLYTLLPAFKDLNNYFLISFNTTDLLLFISNLIKYIPACK